jgi:hypothetical protein
MALPRSAVDLIQICTHTLHSSLVNHKRCRCFANLRLHLADARPQRVRATRAMLAVMAKARLSDRYHHPHQGARPTFSPLLKEPLVQHSNQLLQPI